MELRLTDLLTYSVFDQRPLWIVYTDSRGERRIQACIINRHFGKPTIWGFSVYKRAAGYRTIGSSLEGWLIGCFNVGIYTTEKEALDAAGPQWSAPTYGALPTEAQIKRLISKRRIYPHEE